MMILRNLGKGYRVLDKAGSIDYVKPGVGTVIANFYLTEADIADIKHHTAEGEKYFKVFHVDIVDEQGGIVAKVERTVYIRKKQPKTKTV